MVIKHINFIESTGKLILTDDNDTSYYCDIYGNKIRSFLPDITGQRNSCTKRLEKCGQAGENLGNIEKLHRYPNTHNIYLPIINKFEGYSKFPQPLSPPFYNLNEINDIGRENTRKLIKTLKKHFTNKKVLNQFSLSERNEANYHLTYMMTPIRFCTKYNEEVDKITLIKLIDEHFDNYKNEHKFNADQVHKDPIIKALKRFRKLLEENKNVNVEKKMNLKRPSENILEKYKIVQNKLKKSYVKKKMNNKAVSENLERGLTRNYLKEKMRQNNIENDNENSFLSISSTEDKKLKEEHFICFNLKKSTNINLKSKEFLSNSLELEKEFIEGFKEIPIKEEGIFRKNPNAKFKSEGDFYPDTIKLLKQVNPRAFENLKKKEDYQFKEMVKKRNQKYIFQKNLGY